MDAKTASMRNIIMLVLLLFFLLSTMVVAAPNNVFPVRPASEFLNWCPLLSIYHAGFMFLIRGLDLCNFLFAEKKRSPRNIFVQIKVKLPPPPLCQLQVANSTNIYKCVSVTFNLQSHLFEEIK